MEIHLLLEGEQIGPLSAAQVRQYLDEGRVAATDLASCEGMDDWLPLESVLPFLPPVVADAKSVEEIAETPTSSSNAETEAGESSFIVPNHVVGTFDTDSTSSPTGGIPPLTATQKTKRSKIVLQQILPLETKLPLQKKTGKTALTLEPLRSTISLPSITGHQPKEKVAAKVSGRSGKVALRQAPELPIAAPAPAPLPAEVKVEPVIPPAPAVTEVPVAPEPPAKPAAPVSPVEKAPPQKSPASAPVFSVLPKGTGFMPPSIRTVSGNPMRKTTAKRASFPYAGVALGLFIMLVLVVCIYFLSAKGGASPLPNLFTPRNAISPPAHAQNQAPVSNGPNAASLSDSGMKLQEAGDLDGAIQVYDKALALDPKAVEVYYQRGLALQAKQNMAAAIADYTEVIALDPKRADAYSNRGYIKQGQLDFDGALADYARALALNPNFPVVYNNIGLIKMKKGDLDGAIAAYSRAIELDPHVAFAFYNRGVAKNTEGDVDGAIADYTQAIELNPKIALAFCNRGLARQSKNDTDGAIADYTQALSLDPTLADAFYNRGLIKAQKSDFDGAIGDYNHVLTLDAHYAQAYDKRGLAMVGKNRPAAALSDLKRFCELAPRDPAADEARNYIWLMATVTNANGDADADLSTALLNDWNSAPEDLTSKIAAFLLGHISENDLIADAASPDPAREPAQYCRVWYFAGMKRLLDSDTAVAAGYFQKSMASGQKDLYEYAFSEAELPSLVPNSSHDVAH